MQVILASESPRRKQLLAATGISFHAIPSNIDEHAFDDIPLEERPEELAFQKAQSVAASNPDTIVIGADTIVVLDNEALNKPRNSEDACAMLRKLSGRTHHVLTGVCLVTPTQVIRFTAQASVHFIPLTEEDIHRYVDTQEPLDKAGAYAIQGGASSFVDEIHGDYNAIVGFPIGKVMHHLWPILNHEVQKTP